jgi:putative PIN family toxin of toxin-antitoxin system
MGLGQIRGKKIVIDSNVLTSYLIASDTTRSHLAKVVRYALENSHILLSMELIMEIEDVFSRPKFSKYFSNKDASELVSSIRFIGHMVEINCTIKAARDPKDDKILELAISGEADYIIIGDQDLLVLKTYLS